MVGIGEFGAAISVATQPWQMDASELSHHIRTGRLSSREATQSCLARLHSINPKINAVNLILEEAALRQADQADKHRAAGEPLGPLHGVPVTTKCNTDQVGCPSDNGVIAFRDLIADKDNPVIGNLRAAGAIFIGRTNTPAFSMRFDTSNDLHGRTLNPHSKSHTPGGSSGGAGASVATGIGAIAHGSDIAGSVRWPAYCNGVVGLRPSYGRVPSVNGTSSYGKPISAQLMAVHGPLTRTVRDAWLSFTVMAGHGEDDHRWVDVPLKGRPTPKRVALVRQVPGAPVHPAVAEAVSEAGRRLEAAGYIVEERAPPALEQLYELWHRIGVADTFGALKSDIQHHGDREIQRFSELWEALRPPVAYDDYLKALAERDFAIQIWSVFLREFPLVIMPCAAGAAFRIGDDTKNEQSMAEIMDSMGRYMLPQPVLGLPALSVPLGNLEGLPIGVQIISGRYREDLCCEAGEIIETFEPLHRKMPINPKF